MSVANSSGDVTVTVSTTVGSDDEAPSMIDQLDVPSETISLVIPLSAKAYEPMVYILSGSVISRRAIQNVKA